MFFLVDLGLKELVRLAFSLLLEIPFLLLLQYFILLLFHCLVKLFRFFDTEDLNVLRVHHLIKLSLNLLFKPILVLNI